MTVVRRGTEVRVTKDRVDEIVALVESLTQKEILVGIPQANTSRTNDEPGDTMDNATIGYIMEYGSPAANIPERPFLVPGIRDAVDPIAAQLVRAAEGAIRGQPAVVEARMEAAGLVAQNSVRRKITDGPFTPLAPRTLAKRRARGRTGEKPLLDTGQLRRSVTYVIRERDET